MIERDDAHQEATPKWAKRTLLCAGVYNLLWGAWVVLRPQDLFHFAGIDPPVYIGIWQCVGMIVGVYGVGYLAASSNPAVHWPVTLVGFLGKLFGPVGLVFGLLTSDPDSPGYLPLSFCWITIFNDLIWWIPFAGILLLAFRRHAAPVGTQHLTRKDANAAFVTQQGDTLEALQQKNRVLLVFLRHAGCTFCREAVADLAEQRSRLEAEGIQMVLVHMGTEPQDAFFEAYGMNDVPRISDPECSLYRAYGLGRGKLSQLFGWSVWLPGLRAFVWGRHGVGKMIGDGFQMPGVFLIHQGKVLSEVIHSSAAHRPDYCQIAMASNPASS